MPNTYKWSVYIIGEQGITASRIPQGAVAFDSFKRLDDFGLLRHIVKFVDLDFAMLAPASAQVNAVLSLFQQCLTNDEFTIYPIKKLNPNPKWVVVVEKESAGQ